LASVAIRTLLSAPSGNPLTAMQRAMLLAFALLALFGPSAANDHPVTRVISLLQALHDKVREEGRSEEVTFAQFDSWCKNSIRTLQRAIATERESIDALESEVEAKQREEATLTNHIQELDNELLEQGAAATAAQSLRSNQTSLYTTSDQDLADTITAIGQAITALEGAQTATSAALLQLRLRELAQRPLVFSQLSDEQQRQLLGEASLNASSNASRPDFLGNGSYQASQKKYTFKSGNVIELLKELKTKFEDDRVEGTKGETNAQNAYDLAKDARDSAIAAAGAAKTEKNTLLGDAQSDRAAANASLISTRSDLQADSTSLSDTEQSCTMKKSEWTERQEIRQRELKAIDAGIGILAQVTGVRTSAPSNPVPPPSPVTFLLQKSEDPRARAVNLLRQEAREVRSRAFARFAEEIAARVGGPFDEVNNMIQKMIFRLMAEQRDEDEHKNWCDLELNKTNISKSDKEEKISTLGAKLTSTRATIQLLSNEMVSADQMVATITEHIEEATSIRQVGKAENKQAVQDAKDAQQAIAEAEAVLLEFYKDTGMVAKESWELLQRGGQPVTLSAEPSTWNASYTGVADPMQQPDGIISVLKTISADFATMEASTLAQEETDQRAYDEEIKATEIEKARRAKESEMKTQEKKRLEDKVVSMTSSLKHVTGELGAVDQYLKDLGPACVQGDSTYEDRKAAREKEVQALKEAQVMLADYQSGNSTNATNSSGSTFFAQIKPVNFLARSH